MHNNKHHRRFLIAFVGLTALLVSVMGIVNYVLDPFQVWHDSYFNKDYYIKDQERYQNAGLIRMQWKERACCRALLLGTSHAQNFEGNKLGTTLGIGNVLNLAMSAARPEEELALLRATSKIRQPDIVIWEIHTHFLKARAAAPEPPGARKYFPEFLYDNNPINDASYLLSVSTYALGLKQLRSRHGLYEHKAWYNQYHSSFGNAADIYKTSLPMYEKAIVRKELPQRKFYALDDVIAPALRQMPNTRFIFYFPPYSLQSIASLPEDSFADTIAFRRQLVGLLSQYPNASAYMFDDVLTATENLNNYKDDSHFHPDVGYAAMTMITNGEAKLTQANVEARLGAVERRANAYCRQHEQDCVTLP